MSQIPKNIAIIMDGNRRWSERNKVAIYTGHKQGAKTLKTIISECVKLDVKQLTVFAFSTENWNRDLSEINGLFKLIEFYIKSEIAEMKHNNIIFNSVGDKTKFKKTTYDLLTSAENITRNNTGLKLNICLNYGGILDIVNATKMIVKKALNSEVAIENIDINYIKKHLLSFVVSDIDLLIRTGGEKRISNFLPIQLSYSEMYFTETFWPDFDKKMLIKAFDQFSKRERRFGSTPKIKNNHI